MVVQENSEESGEESPPAESTISQRPKRNPRKRVVILSDDDDASDASDPVSDRSYQPDQEEVVGKKIRVYNRGGQGFADLFEDEDVSGLSFLDLNYFELLKSLQRLQ